MYCRIFVECILIIYMYFELYILLLQIKICSIYMYGLNGILADTS